MSNKTADITCTHDQLLSALVTTVILTSVVTSNWVCSSRLVSMASLVVVTAAGSTEANKTSATLLVTSVAAGVIGIVSSRLSRVVVLASCPSLLAIYKSHCSYYIRAEIFAK